jgi:4-hydroxybenzoyl-CoA thioesterase
VDDRALSPRPRPVAPADLHPALWRTERVVRFSDCDPAGIVYTARFVDMLNGVVEDFFPGALGLDYGAIIRGGVGLGYAKVDCDFLRPGQMGDRLTASVEVARVGRASAGFVLHLHRGEAQLLRASLVMVTTSLSAHKAIPLPADLRAALTAYQDRCR